MLVLLSSIACNLLTQIQSLEPTQTAVSLQQTQLAKTMAAMAAGIETPIPSPTLAAEAALATLAGLDPPAVLETPGPDQTPTISPGAAPEERLLKSARILLFEDMSASRYVRLVKQALDEAGYSYLDVGSAKGWFKTQLLSEVDWDLIIAAAEAEREFGGEFYEYLADRVQSGSSVVIENWDLDAAPDGKAGVLLDLCGLRVQEDWYLPDLPVFYWTDPAHPVFNQPNSLRQGLRQAKSIWSGDLGDLLQVKAGTQVNSVILASLNPNWTGDHGLIASCRDGQVVLQTFRSHQYHPEDMVALWQNYIFQALQNRFNRVERIIPTPEITFTAPNPPATVMPKTTPGPEYTFPHACGEALTVRITRAPVLTQDLFEHHAGGIFVVLRLEAVNTSAQAVQIWDEDYTLESMVNDQSRVYTIQPAATGYLYLEDSTRLWQDLIQPGETYRTALAFDIHPAAKDLVFVLRPGSEFQQTVCEVRIPLNR